MKTGKRIVSILLVALLLLTAAPMSSFVGLEIAPKVQALAATGQCGDNVYWSFDESTGALTISGTGPMKNYSIFDRSPFYDSKEIKSIVIGNSVTSIGDGAFAGCINLTSVTIGDSVTSIGDSAFYNCYSITSVTVPNSVTSIGNYAFGECRNLTSVTIGDSVTSIGNYAFADCWSLTSITIPDSVTSIDYLAFFACSSLKSVTIPNSVTYIGFNTFEDCSSLMSITVNENNSAYASDSSGCLYNKDKTRLIKYPIGNARAGFSIPNSVMDIDAYAFSGSSNLTSVMIPDSVTDIGNNAFLRCSSLENVTIPYGVTMIAYDTFHGCSNLTSVTIPESVTGIGETAFEDCTSLKDVYYRGSQTQWNAISIYSDNECLLNGTIHYNSSGSEQPTEVPVESIELNGFTTEIPLIMEKGTSKNLFVTITPANATNQTVQWSSSDPSVATVNQDGLVVSLREGITFIEAAVYDNNTVYKDNCKVIVRGNGTTTIELPENYDFTKDSYSFPNDTNNSTVNLKYKHFINMFDPATAFLLYLSNRKLIGLCFGFSYTTAAIFNGVPRVSNFYKGNPTDEFASTIRELGIRSELVKGSSSLENKKVDDSFRLLDYIIYAHIYQLSPRVAKTEKQTMNKIGELYNTVKAYTQENKLGVTIGMNMRNSPNCHRVLAVGIDGKDILIDDPNDPTKLKRIEINGNQWSFGSGKYNSESADIMYNTDILEPYRILTGAKFLAPAKTNRIVDNLKSDTGYCLLKIEADKFNLDTEEFYEIPFAEGFEQEDDSPLYWIENNNTVHISDVENGGKITAAADDIILATSLEKKSSVEMSLNETKNIVLDTEKDSKVSFSFSTVDEELNEAKVSISGIANTDKVLANKTEDGYQVSGLNDISVVYYQNDEVKAKTDAEVKDGREVSISVSDNGDAVSTDFETVHTHADTDNDGKCDTCGEKMTGGDHCKYCGKIHSGPFGWLVKFFHSIFALFKR